ncbi:S1 family peptidase [uncultured Jannaschia sp.]|uniref:trypsin-like serine peptidase n=1 Tax=uncultured Jannaschia sp. TaxID=293347 RepID=UPI00260DE9D7|nr:S1 family peptidase [uncultured Jannaschia sp.]
MTGLSGLLLAATLLLVTALSASADTRLRVLDTTEAQSGWEAVGRLIFRPGGFCTGALIAPELVLTAAHCLYNPRSGRRFAPGEIEFQAGFRHGRAAAYRKVRRVVLHPDYDFADSDKLDRAGRDLALLQLDRAVRLNNVEPFATRKFAQWGEVVQVVSYGAHRADAPLLEEGCTILSRVGVMLVLDCSVEFGSSGAPVFVDAGGEVRILGIISGMAEWKGREISLAVSMGADLEKLLARIRG